MDSHFIDLNIIIKEESSAWVVSKENPNFPLLKMAISDFNLFQSGIYKSHNNKLDFNGKIFWISNEFMEKIKLSTKKYNVDISTLAISLQEFMNKELIENIPFTINTSIFNSIVNTDDDVYIICSKNTKNNYEKKILKLEEELKKIGVQIKNYYFISETFNNRNKDEIAYYKVRLLLQHFLGLKIKDEKFTDEVISDYNRITFYDDSKNAIELAKRINHLLEKILNTADNDIKIKIKEKIKNEDNILVVKEYTNNKSKEFLQTIVQLEYSNLIRTFESFNFSYSQ